MGINQLVDAYKGNPAPLQARVQQAQKNQPPGAIPPDLEEAIALQKITELRNSAQGQQAMQAGGAQPSVVDKLKQMLAGDQAQAQMGQAPQQPSEGQPVMAARGGSIDQLMSNLGRHYAGGGIVAFNGKDGSDVPTEAELEAQRKADREKLEALTKALGQTGGEYAGKSMAALADIASLIPRGLAGAVDTALIRPARALGADVGYLSPALTPGNQNPDTMTPFYDRYILAKEKDTSSQVKPTPVPGAPLDAETKKLLNLAASQAQTGVNTNPNLVPRKPVVGTSPDDARPRPSAGGGGGSGGSKQTSLIDELVSQGLITKPGDTAAYKKMAGVMNMDADTEETKAINKFKQQVGDRDLSIYDQMAAELKARKERLNAPAKGYDALMEYLGQIAQSGGGRNWMEAGAKGAAGLNALQKARQDQQDTLVDKILDLGAKKKEAEYAQKEKMYDIGQARYKDVFKNAFEAAKDVNKSDDEARKIAIEAVLRQKEMDNRIQQANISAAGRGAGSGDRQQLNELKALQTSLKDQLKEPRMMGKAGDDARRQLAIVNAEIAKMAGISTMMPAPGAGSPGGTSLKYNPKTGKIE